MRETFLNCLVELAKLDPDIFLITGDLGFKVLDPFRNLFPDRFLNVGVAEQNMIGVATGLALEGKKVYVYSIANFPTLRCLEQIRNDICYHDLNVKIVAVGGGFSYGPLGVSHHATEDIAVMRSLPNMSVVAPGSKRECATITKLINSYEHPLYLRLGRSNEELNYAIPEDYFFGQAVEIKKGTHKAILCCGGALSFLKSYCLDIFTLKYGVFSVPFISPVDINFLMTILQNYEHIVTIEDHSVVGGFGSIILEYINKYNLNCSVTTLGFTQSSHSVVANEPFLIRKFLFNQFSQVL